MESPTIVRVHKKLLLALLALCAALLFGAAPARAQTYGPFFTGAQFIGFDETGYAAYYLPKFGYFTYLGKTPGEQPYPGYLYKYDFGYLYSFGNSGGSANDVYFYDFGQNSSVGYLYTSSTYGSRADDYLYCYVFSPYNTFMVYFQSTYKARIFYEFSKSDYLYFN